MERWMHKWGAGCCLTIMISVVLAMNLTNDSVQASHARSQATSDQAFEQVIEDLHWLYAVIDPLRESDLRLVASSYGVIERSEELQPEEIVWRILQPFARHHIELQSDDASAQGIVTYHDGITLSISVQAQSSTEALIVARLEANHIEMISRESAVLEWWSQLDERWALELSQRPEWRINLQAELDSHRSPADLWDALESVDASVIDDSRYHDDGSASRVFHAPGLHQSVMMRDFDVHLQAAVHRSSEDHTYRITLGTPLITIEY